MRYLGKEMPPRARSPQEPAAASTILRVRTLGGFAAWCGPVAIPATAWSPRKQTLIFKCLISAPGQKLHRDQAVDMFWPEHDSTHGARLLRQSLYRLRHRIDIAATGHSYIRLEGDFVVLAPSLDGSVVDDWLDALAFEHSACAALAGTSLAACRTALALYTGEYLPDDRYVEWAIARRELLRGQYIALLLHLSHLREQHGALNEAMRCLHTVLAIEPCHEEAAQALMRMQTASGRYLEAVRTYRQLSEALERDLDLEPDRSSEAQYQVVLACRQTDIRRLTNLPSPLTSFVGREEALQDLMHLLAGRGSATEGRPVLRKMPRLVTIVGSGGSGKTRLAVELGAELRARYEGGVWLVELAALPPAQSADTSSIVQQALGALDLTPRSDQSLFDALRDRLVSRRALIILDNCEHLIEGCAGFASAVLTACPDVQVLATSRQTLGMVGEIVWRLPSLNLPSAADHTCHNPAALNRFAAVRLLVERAQAVKPQFALTIENCRSVAAICRCLDGIPLAIELAAARLAVLSCEDLERRLAHRFRELASGNRAALPRHQTLYAVIDWSYRLLNAPEQALLRLLSVFAGSWTLDAAEEICAGSAILGDTDVLDHLARLADKSLVDQEGQGEGTGRYRMLETVRQYAAEQLCEHGEEAWARAGLAQWCLALVEQAAPALTGPDQEAWLNRLETEHDNLRVALTWYARDEGDADAGLRMTGALWLFWGYRGHWTEGRRWLSAALARTSNDRIARLRALRALGALAENQCDYRQAHAAQVECLTLARACRNTDEIANALNGLGNIAKLEHNLPEAAALYQETLAMSRQEGNARGIARALHNLALIAQEEGDYASAITLCEESLAFRRSLGDQLAVASTQYNQAISYRLAGDLERATAMHRTLLSQFEGFGDRWSVMAVHNELGRIACDNGQHQAASIHLGVSLKGFRELGDTAALTDVLENWAVLVARQGNAALATRLLGTIDAAHVAIGQPLPPGLQEVFVADVALARELLGADDLFAAKWAEGQIATVDDAVTEVLGLYLSGLPAE